MAGQMGGAANLGGMPILILRDTRRETGKDAISNNITAARAVANIVRSTLGPKGMDKLLVDSTGDVTITNDGVTILKEMDVQHPAAKMLIEAAKTQDKEVGDGTTTVAIFAGELLKKAEDLLGMGVHPTVIVEGYQLAATKSFEILKSIAIDVSDKDRDLLEKVTKTAMTGKWAESPESKISKFTVDLVLGAIEITPDGKKTVDYDAINVEKKVGESIDDSEMVPGVVVDKPRVHENMPRKIEKAKIALLSVPLESRSTETKAEIQITSSSQFQMYMNQEKEAIKAVVDKVLATGANVVFCQKGIDDTAQHLLANAGVFALRRVIKNDLEKLSKATGANIVTNLEEITPANLGTADLVEEKNVSNGVMTFVTGTKNKSVTLLLRGGTKQVVDSLERALDDAIHAIADVIEDQKIVAGGGAPEMELSLRLREYAATFKGREQLGILKFAEAIEVVPRALAENAGLNPIDKLVELRRRHETDKTATAGLNVYNGQIVNMLDMGVVEPIRIKIQAIQSATDAASLILRIDDILSSTKKKPEGEGRPGMGGMPPGMMGGMGGMGGMPGMMPGMGGMGMPGLGMR